MKGKRFKRVMTLILVGVMFVMSLGVASATYYPDVDYWNLNYIANAPASVSIKCKSLKLAYYSNGYVAKASSLSGSYDRRILIEGQGSYVIQNSSHSMTITVVNSLTSSFSTNFVSNQHTDFIASALGYLTCTSTGFVSINSASVYNNA